MNTLAILGGKNVWLYLKVLHCLMQPVLQVILGKPTMSLIPIKLLRKVMQLVLIQVHSFQSNLYALPIVIFLISTQITIKNLTIPQTSQAFKCARLDVKAHHRILFAWCLLVHQASLSQDKFACVQKNWPQSSILGLLTQQAVWFPNQITSVLEPFFILFSTGVLQGSVKRFPENMQQTHNA